MGFIVGFPIAEAVKKGGERKEGTTATALCVPFPAKMGMMKSALFAAQKFAVEEMAKIEKKNELR
jgi:hypothetical protein